MELHQHHDTLTFSLDTSCQGRRSPFSTPEDQDQGSNSSQTRVPVQDASSTDTLPKWRVDFRAFPQVFVFGVPFSSLKTSVR